MFLEYSFSISTPMLRFDTSSGSPYLLRTSSANSHITPRLFMLDRNPLVGQSPVYLGT
jgi:hypothetical protein